jgi:hypothetical protein
MDFLLCNPKKKEDTLYIEIIADKYIKNQPLTETDVNNKVREYVPIIQKIHEYPLKNLIIIIDCDKALEYQRINFVLGCKLVYKLYSYFGEDYLPDKIHVIHSNTFILSMYTGMRPLLPQSVLRLVTFS